MSTTAFKSAPKAVSRDTCRSGEVPGDWERWLETRGETDDLRQERLRRGLRRARREELTARQRQVLALVEKIDDFDIVLVDGNGGSPRHKGG